MKQALNGHGQAFRKARPQPRISQTLGALDGQQAGSGRDSPVETWEERRAPSAGSSNDSEPPLNIPRDWGRKGKQTNGWLRRMRDSEVDAQAAKPDADAIYPHKTSFTGDESPRIDWLAAAEKSLNHIGTSTSPSGGRRDHLSKSTSLREQTSAFERVEQWDVDQDLTAASLLASTPAYPSRTTRYDEIRRREIQGIERRGIATSRLDRISERTPSETLRRRSGPKLRDGLGDTTTTRSATSPETRHLNTNSQKMKENIPVNPSQVQKNINPEGLMNGTGSSAKDIERPNRSSKDDSLAMLKRLARGISKSPSPTPGGDHEGQVAVHPVIISAPQTSLQVGKSAEKNQTPSVSREKTLAKTPVVTGAWVDTPKPNVPPLSATTVTVYSPPNDSPDTSQQPQKVSYLHNSPRHVRTRSEPMRPSSALADIVRSARSHPLDSAFGDDTIASLEDLLDPTLQVTETLDLDNMRSELDRLHDPGRPITQADKDRGLELDNIDSMNKHLKAARTSIKDAKTGLRKFERDIDAATTSSSATVKKEISITGCGACGVCGHKRSIFQAMWRECCDLFYRQEPTRASGIQLTWLGTICTTIVLWYVLESTLGYVDSSSEICTPSICHPNPGSNRQY